MNSIKYHQFDKEIKVKSNSDSKISFKESMMKSIYFSYLLFTHKKITDTIYCKSCNKVFDDVSISEYINNICINCRINK